MKLSMIVPCYNEEANVRAFVQAVEKELSPKHVGYMHEIIFINDGSKDNTLSELKKLVDEQADTITVVDFTRNFGKEAALYAGLQKAEGDFIAFIDADLQQPLSVVREMTEFLLKNDEYDAVAAYQDVRQEGKALSFLKKTFYQIINLSSDVPFHPNASDFRVIRRSVAQAILAMPEYYRFSKGIFSWVGFNTYYRPYHAVQRHAGTTSWSTVKLFHYAVDGIVSFSTKPLKLATGCGFIFSAIAILYMLVVIIQKFLYGNNVPGYPTLVVLILLIGGVQLIVLGIIGEYLARIHIETKRRPIYLIRSCYSTISHEKQFESSK